MHGGEKRVESSGTEAIVEVGLVVLQGLKRALVVSSE